MIVLFFVLFSPRYKITYSVEYFKSVYKRISLEIVTGEIKRFRSKSRFHVIFFFDGFFFNAFEQIEKDDLSDVPDKQFVTGNPVW